MGFASAHRYISEVRMYGLRRSPVTVTPSTVPGVYARLACKLYGHPPVCRDPTLPLARAVYPMPRAQLVDSEVDDSIEVV
eukprot:2270567-Prymnesium_polylepis.1